MATGLLLQYLVIAIAVIASSAYVLRVQWPGATRRARVAFALALMQASRPVWIQRIGRRLAPAVTAASKCGGCSSCD